MKKLTLPLSPEDIAHLHAGDGVLLTGVIYTARDCAHRRLFELLDAGKQLPIDLKSSYIYYAGPCPAPEGKACGSCGPTTAARMNTFAPRLLDLGLCGMIGKGEMSNARGARAQQKGVLRRDRRRGRAVRKRRQDVRTRRLSRSFERGDLQNGGRGLPRRRRA